MGGREHRGRRAALGEPEDDRALDSGGVQDGERVVDDVLEGVRAGVAVRHAHAALVEGDQPGERTHAFPEAGGQRMRHGELEVTDETADHEDVDRTPTADGVRDGDVAVVRVADRFPVHHLLSMAVSGRR